MFWRVMKTAIGVAQFGCVCHCVMTHVGTITQCFGYSMIPSLQHGDWIVSECISVRRQSLQKGDIVIALSPTNPSMFVCKRIIGLEGDKVDTSNDTKESVPKGHVWLEGDNKDVSVDSRKYGAVPYGLIHSRMACKILSAKNTGTS